VFPTVAFYDGNITVKVGSKEQTNIDIITQVRHICRFLFMTIATASI